MRTISSRHAQDRLFRRVFRALDPLQFEECFLAWVRKVMRWGIENGLHWVLDIAFQTDQSRLHKGHGAHNFAMLRHIALNRLKQEKTEQRGIKAKRLRAAVNEKYLTKVLTNQEAIAPNTQGSDVPA